MSMSPELAAHTGYLESCWSWWDTETQNLINMKGDIYCEGFGVKTNNCIVLQDGCPGIRSNEIIVSTF